MAAMRRLSWLLPVAFFFLNPGFACGPAEPRYSYDAAEMRAAVEGVWSFTITPQGAANTLQLTVKIEQATAAPGAQARSSGRSLVRAAQACGSRTLVKSAGACLDSSVMPLAVTFVAGDASFSGAALSGTFIVDGVDFGPFNSRLALMLGDYSIDAQVAPDGTVLNANVGPGPKLGTLTVLARE
ncbi:MAG TPA: hypothetical protein VHL80_12420 [Polyangia bacterium]|nr:hypothetical protein [Polyangia bacterium]